MSAVPLSPSPPSPSPSPCLSLSLCAAPRLASLSQSLSFCEATQRPAARLSLLPAIHWSAEHESVAVEPREDSLRDDDDPRDALRRAIESERESEKETERGAEKDDEEEDELSVADLLPAPRCVSDDERDAFSQLSTASLSLSLPGRESAASSPAVLALSPIRVAAAEDESETHTRRRVPLVAATRTVNGDEEERHALLAEDEAYQRLWATRKVALERQAEERARAKFLGWQRDKKTLREAIDGSLKEYVDLYECAHALRLQFEDERQRWTGKVLSIVNSKVAHNNMDQFMYQLHREEPTEHCDPDYCDEPAPKRSKQSVEDERLFSLDDAGISLAVRKKFSLPARLKQ